MRVPNNPDLGKRTPAILAVLLAVLTLAVYWQTAGFDYINLDDPGYTTFNPFLKNGLSLSGIKGAFASFHERYWIPATWLSYMADVSLFGMKAGAFHLTNVILHVFNVLLLFWLFSSATGSVWKCFFAAALFAVHPLRAESVAWIAERKDVLASFFFLLACIGHVKYAKSGKKSWLVAVAVCALLGLMAKPVVMVLPVALLLLDFWPLGRLPEGRIGENVFAYKKLLLEKAHLFAFSVICAAVASKAQRLEQSLNVDMSAGSVNWGGLAANIATATKSYYAYLAETFWPVGLILHGREHRLFYGPVLTLVILAGLAALSWAAFRFRRDFPEFAFGWFWYLLVLFPASGIVQEGISTFADRFTYLPHMGLAVALTWSAERLWERRARDFKSLVIVGLATVIALWVLCFNQVSKWRDDATLFGYMDYETGGKSAVTKNALGMLYYRTGEYQKAYDSFYLAKQLDRQTNHITGNMGLAAGMLGRYAQAADLCRQQLQMTPDNFNFNICLARYLILAGDVTEGARQALLNIRHWPREELAWEAVNYLGGEYKANMAAGTGLASKGQHDEAIRHFNEALRLSPNDPNARAMLYSAQKNLGR